MWQKDNEIYDGIQIVINDRRIINPTEQILKEAGYEWIEPIFQKSEAQVIKEYENAVQMHLDSTAKLKGYDNTYTCLSYLNSTDETWKREANAFNKWRDQVWRSCHEILNKFKKGEIEQPTVAQVIEQLPKIDWSNQ